MIDNIFRMFFSFLFVLPLLVHAYGSSHSIINVSSDRTQKKNMYWGIAPTHIKLPYERPHRSFKKSSTKDQSNKSAERTQEVQCHQQSSYVETTRDKQKNYQQLCNQIEANFQGQYHEFKQYCEYEYGECNQEFYTVLNRSGRLEKRFAALQNIDRAGVHYAQYNHLLTQEAANNLKALGYDVESYKFCYGNQIQQVIHEDCITLLQETRAIPTSSIIYNRVPAITDCIDAARAYNQAADCIKACTIQDFCWSLLEYGKAVVEGAAWGAVGAVQDCLQHPLHTAACVIIPEGILVYQLSKVLVNVADIGATYLFDKEKGQRKLHDYIAPLAQIIHTLQNKQLSGPEIVRGTTQLAIHWKAQSKLLSGLSKLYSTSKIKVEQFIKENPFAVPEQYMATPEGLLLKACDESLDSSFTRSKSISEYVSENSKRGSSFIKITNKQALEMAQELGFKKTNFYSHGHPVFQKGNKFITIDVDSHNGGVWKMANSLENLASKRTRLGTYDKNLNRIGD